jgi:very-long-chain (3R)-3-hydroxyacyl-CoA dehydratase
MFYILYPIGIGAEWWLMYRSIEPVGRISAVLPPVFYFLLALYVPGMLLFEKSFIGNNTDFV